MMTSKSSTEPAKEISTDAIASFVYGTIQITLTVIVVVLFWYFSSKFGEMFGTNTTSAPKKLSQCIGATECSNYFKSVPSEESVPTPTNTVAEHIINGKEVIFIFVSNILSFLGVGSGISALREIAKFDKIGTNLATLGLFSSVLCLGLTIFLTWLVDLPL